MQDPTLTALAGQLAEVLTARSLTLAVAESCTGGLLAHSLTAIAGSSDWFTGGVVAYSNGVKAGILGVPEEIFRTEGAVSRSCVRAMAGGVCRALGTETGIAISGIAGPSGGSPEKPVGTVWIAWRAGDEERQEVFRFDGDRLRVKEQSVEAAMRVLTDMLGGLDALRPKGL